VNLGSPPPPQPANPFLTAALRSFQDERGMGLVEVVMASVIIVILATAVAGVLTSSIAATAIAGDRTKAEECAADQMEQIRRKDYDSVGTIGGNPSGTVPATAPCGNGFRATATISISYNNDPTPTSYATGANYKKATVSVTRNRDGKQLTSVVTFVAPSSRAPYGGINNAIINATVVDLGTNLAFQGATVHLSDGPSANRSDTTDVAGTVSFAALTPNPTTGPLAYYDLTVDGVTGYQTLTADVPPGAANPPATASHIQLAPSQTSST
jgi:type II secretory pathway pseudopilin PulG